MTWAIQTYELTKRFPITDSIRGMVMPRRFYEPAVDHVNLSVGEGELFGLLGSNGAGKTTLIKLICTLIHPTEGEALVFGHPLKSDNLIKNQIGLGQ